MNILNKDTVALVLSTNDNWKTCCVTEYSKDGTWNCGMNFITSLEDAIRTAEENSLNIIFEKMLDDRTQELSIEEAGQEAKKVEENLPNNLMDIDLGPGL